MMIYIIYSLCGRVTNAVMAVLGKNNMGKSDGEGERKRKTPSDH